MHLNLLPASLSRLRFLRATCWSLALFCSIAATLPIQAQVSKEYQLKAVLLFRLSQFVEWPTHRFASPQSPVIIGILGKNPFGDSLQEAVRGETSSGRPIEVRHLQEPSGASSCHIVFITVSEEPRVRDILGVLSGQAVLTVSDIDNFARAHGGMVRFVTVGNRVTLRINVERAKAAGIAINSRLLRMAEIVRGE